MKQIILITDGCSNVGVSPVIAAAHALEDGITVNVIGVIDRGELGKFGMQEINEIAEAGGGLSRIVGSSSLSETVQMMTRKTVAHTVRQAVGAELRSIMGDEFKDIAELRPEKRAQVVRVIDEMEEMADLQIALLVDASASMKPKLGAVKEAIQDLMKSLQARVGSSRMAVVHFPGAQGDEVRIDLKWSNRLAKVSELFYNINMKGTTPTGPALLRTVRYFSEEASAADNAYAGQTLEQSALMRDSKDGISSDYGL
ncbi:MAG: VWA domain-containing protein [Gorillibacterium sp.]|nr:VWA domain-containing protein [Gorillibacterium sp.]